MPPARTSKSSISSSRPADSDGADPRARHKTGVVSADSSRLVRARSKLREGMDTKISKLTNGRVKRMKWTPRGYARIVVWRGWQKLVGWPEGEGFPFGNLSDIEGGTPVMEYLLGLWESGEMRFEEASDEEMILAFNSPVMVIPGLRIAGSSEERESMPDKVEGTSGDVEDFLPSLEVDECADS